MTREEIEDLFSKTKKRLRKRTKLQSPAFKNEALVINADFWNHLKFQKNKKPRTHEDILSRLRAIDTMIEIIENAPYYQDYFTGKDKNNIMHFWTILATCNDIRYCVVVRKKGKQGNKHIYSIIPNWRGYIPRAETPIIKG
jgi:hypothetical protein